MKDYSGKLFHIAVYSTSFGGHTGIEMKDFSGLSSRCTIYTESNDYSGIFLTNQTVPDEYLCMVKGKVVLNKHVIIGSGSLILPGCELGEGVEVGSMSCVHKSLPEWNNYFRIPCKRMKSIRKDLLELDEQLCVNQKEMI